MARCDATPRSSEEGFNVSTADQILKYASLIAKRGWVCNTLGNIAVRHGLPKLYQPHGVIYTKQRGVSLEEMDIEHVVVTDVREGALLHGTTPPSIGHLLNRAVFTHRPDANAIIHLHINSVIALCSATDWVRFPFISADAPLVMGKPVYILSRGVDVESDASSIPSFIADTNCFIMPNHGVTTLGKTLAEAYHRMCTLVAEVERILMTMTVVYAVPGRVGKIPWLSDEKVSQMFRAGDDVIYGQTPKLR